MCVYIYFYILISFYIYLLCIFGGCREKGDLKATATSKVEQITAELKTVDGDKPAFDPVERIKSGFIHFKKEKYE